MSSHRCSYIVLALFLLYSAMVGAQDKAPEFFTFNFENDLFVKEWTSPTFTRIN